MKMKFKTYIKTNEAGRKINNLNLLHIAILVDVGANPRQFRFIEQLTNRYVFEHIPSGKLVSIRR